MAVRCLESLLYTDERHFDCRSSLNESNESWEPDFELP